MRLYEWSLSIIQSSYDFLFTVRFSVNIDKHGVIRINAFFISNTFISNARLKLEKIKHKLSNNLGLNFSYLKIIRFLHPNYHANIIRHILKSLQMNKCVCFKNTLMQIWKAANIFVVMWKNVKDFTLKQFFTFWEW